MAQGGRPSFEHPNQDYGLRIADDGTVEILAVCDADSMKSFERDIEVYDKYGPQVFHVEKALDGETAFPVGLKDYLNFVIEKDREE